MNVMSQTSPLRKFTINAAFFQEIKDDHLQLQELLGSLRNLTDHRQSLPNHACAFTDKLFRLCDQLALHFSLEEAYGYIEDIIESTPHLHVRTGLLRDEHTKLFVMVRDLADRAAARHKGANDELMLLADQFVEFDQALKIHEAAEVKMILTALNQDEGGGD
jgi:hemerythrin-like domain-containing protein